MNILNKIFYINIFISLQLFGDLSESNPVITIKNIGEEPIKRVRFKVQYSGELNKDNPVCSEKDFVGKGFLRTSAIVQDLNPNQSVEINLLTDSYKKLRQVEEPKVKGEKRIKRLTGGVLKPADCMSKIKEISILACVVYVEEAPGKYRKYKVELADKSLGRNKVGLKNSSYFLFQSNDELFLIVPNSYKFKRASKLKDVLPEEKLAEAQKAHHSSSSSSK